MRRYLPWALVVITVSACAGNARPRLTPEQMAPLWIAPADLEQRDLYYGVGGPSLVPPADGRYGFLSEKTTGTQPGFNVTDAQGREWSVKQGVESRVETVVSRLVWALGYHQPVLYYLPQWTMTRDGAESVQPGGRFRLETGSDKAATWSWRDNPFNDTRQLRGLLVLMIMVNNWDLKTAQNTVYQSTDVADPSPRFVVKDLGASFGRTRWFSFSSKDDPDGFDREGFIRRIRANRVEFYFEGAWREPQLHGSVTPDDVRWTCELLKRLTPRQWSDAFRAGGFTEVEAQRYIRRLNEKIDEGTRLSD